MNKKEKNRRFSQYNFSSKNRKGVSPVIATVLLIGLVITLGAVVFVWFQNFTHEAVTKFEGENIELVCADVQFTANINNGNLAISNTGNVPVYSFNVKIDKGAGSYTTKEITEAVSNWPKIGLRSSGVFSGDISSYISGATKVTLIPILRGTVSNGDERSFTCAEQYGKTISI